MPKMKTHSGTKKRCRLTGTGKVRRATAHKSHRMTSKGNSQLRRLEKNRIVHKSNEKAIKALLCVGG